MKFTGLTEKEVEKSRQDHGSNMIPDSEPTTFWKEFKETFKDPIIRLLLAITAIMLVMFFMGHAEIYEPLGIVVAVIIVAIVTARTGVASDTKYRELKENSEKDTCKVYRNGVATVIDVDDVVETLRNRPGTQHVVMTGRDADPKLIEVADLVTEMTKIKHPMDVGRKGQKGIEW